MRDDGYAERDTPGRGQCVLRGGLTSAGTMARILVAGDEPLLRHLLRVTIGSDHRVTEATDGAVALRCLLAERPDLVILDVDRPVERGLAVCRAARAEPSLAGLGLIVLSAHADGGASLAAGADRHFGKPFSPLALLYAIDEVLATRRVEPADRATADTDAEGYR